MLLRWRVSFVQPSDQDYLRAKRIKQGQSRVDPVVNGTSVERFCERYGISPLAVALDTFESAARTRHDTAPRQVLEGTDKYRSFLRSQFNFDKDKQKAIAVLLTESLRGAYPRAMFGLLPRPPPAAVRADNSACSDSGSSRPPVLTSPIWVKNMATGCCCCRCRPRSGGLSTGP